MRTLLHKFKDIIVELLHKFKDIIVEPATQVQGYIIVEPDIKQGLLHLFSHQLNRARSYDWRKQKMGRNKTAQ
jgi:hypothetical protein